jgi:hypothetical protein
MFIGCGSYKVRGNGFAMITFKLCDEFRFFASQDLLKWISIKNFDLFICKLNNLFIDQVQ